MNKFWGLLLIIEGLTAITGIPLFVISLIINVICAVAGFKETAVFEITNDLCSFLLTVAPFLALLWVFNGLHAVETLINKHK